jgi:hypothetical protein
VKHQWFISYVRERKLVFHRLASTHNAKIQAPLVELDSGTVKRGLNLGGIFPSRDYEYLAVPHSFKFVPPAIPYEPETFAQ